jgi:protein-S-isoprenylcysteine O-methyltransferase Ste14
LHAYRAEYICKPPDWSPHPLYLGEILRNFGVVSIFSSGYGILLIMIGTILLLSRIKTEEEMLVEAFGSDYEDYRRRTKRLIPHFYC